MLNGLPSFDFVFESIDEVLFGQRLVLSLVDFIDETFLFDHFAGNDFVALGVYGEIGLGEAAKTKHFVFDRVSTVDYLESMRLLHSFFQRFLTLHSD